MSSVPLTKLNTYRLLGRSGLRVSPLCLGTMTFGEEWGWGASKEDSKSMFDMYCDHGGNFIDTANFYTNGTSETLLGEFIAPKRDRFVIATKYTLSMHRDDPNAGGNSRKNLVQSLDESLKRLKTNYIDLYWVHMWDQLTPVEEVVRALDDQVRLGKIRYIGFSDAPAWKVSQAQTIALLRSWTPFVGLQVEYNLIERTVERELVPMALELGLGITPWSPLAGGLLSGKYGSAKAAPSADAAKRDMSKKLVPRNLEIADTLIKVAKQEQRSAAQVGLNWLLQRSGVTSVIIGARKPEQIQDNLEALTFTLSQGSMAELDKVSAIELGFPGRFLASDHVQDFMTGGTTIIR